MYTDKFLELAVKQALTATGSSTNTIDLENSENIGVGTPMLVEIAVNATAATGGTYALAIRTSDTETGGNLGGTITTILSKTFPAADLVAGYRNALFIPPSFDEFKRYVDVRWTLGGTSPTLTYSAYLSRADMIDRWKSFKSGYAVL